MIIIGMRSREVARQPEKARHCSHCFQYYLASQVLAFFCLPFFSAFQPLLNAHSTILNRGVKFFS